MAPEIDYDSPYTPGEGGGNSGQPATEAPKKKCFTSAQVFLIAVAAVVATVVVVILLA